MSVFQVDVKAFKVFEVEADSVKAAREQADALAEDEGWGVDGESDVEVYDDEMEQEHARAMLGADRSNWS